MSLFCCRYSHNTLETWKVLDIKRKQPGRPVDMGQVTLPPLYTGPLSLKVNKLQVLQQLLAYIPPSLQSTMTFTMPLRHHPLHTLVRRVILRQMINNTNASFFQKITNYDNAMYK